MVSLGVSMRLFIRQEGKKILALKTGAAEPVSLRGLTYLTRHEKIRFFNQLLVFSPCPRATKLALSWYQDPKHWGPIPSLSSNLKEPPHIDR